MKTIKPPLFGTIAISSCLAVCGYSQTFLTNGLVAYYPFNGNANDASGNGNNGTVIGTDWKFLPDRFGNPQSALFLNTTSTPSVTLNGGYMSAPRSSALNFSNDFTLSVWVNNRSGVTNQQETLISNGNDGLGYIDFAIDPSLAALGGKDRLAFSWGGNNAVNGVLAPAPNSWRQLVAVRSGTNMTVFESGIALTNSASTTAPLDSPTIWLGRFQPVPSGNTNTLQLFGGIDDVRIYNRALSVSEVEQLYVYESGPRVDLIKIVQPLLSNLTLGTNYQLQVSTDLNTWTNNGLAFTATNSSEVYPQYFDVGSFGELFFRLQVVP